MDPFFPEFWFGARSPWRLWRRVVIPILPWCIDNSSILACLARACFFNFLAFFCLIFSEESIPHFQFSTQASCCLFEPDQPIDSPVVAVIVGTRTPNWSHTRATSEFLFSQCSTSTSASHGQFACLLMHAQRFGLNLSKPFDLDPRRLETTVSRSMSAQVSLMPVRPTTESQSANTFVRLVPNAPSFDNVGSLLAAECCLKLRNVEANKGPQKWWSSRRSLAGNSCFTTEGWSACARYLRRCRTWALNLCVGSDWPDDQAVHPRAELHTGLVWFQ